MLGAWHGRFQDGVMLHGANRHAVGENNRWAFGSAPAERPIGRFRIIFGRWHPEPGANGEKRRGQSVNIDDSLNRRLVTFRDAAQGITSAYDYRRRVRSAKYRFIKTITGWQLRFRVRRRRCHVAPWHVRGGGTEIGLVGRPRSGAGGH